MRNAQIKTFHNVALIGRFSVAVEALGPSQPALWEQVRQPEVSYDLLIFRRQNLEALFQYDVMCWSFAVSCARLPNLFFEA